MRSVRRTLLTRRVVVGLVAILASVTLLPAAELIVVRHSLTDNGDDDGFADPNETVQLRILLRNEGDKTVSGIEAFLRSSDPARACITQSTVAVGSLLPGEERWTTGEFTIQIGDVQREGVCSNGGGPCETDAECTGGPGDRCDAAQVELDARLQLYLSVDSVLQPQLREIVLPLDLDVSGGSVPTAFVEGFESGDLGSFVANNMDVGLHGLAPADGYRCQYNDPDWPNSNTFGSSSAAACYPGPTLARAEQFFWQVDDAGAPDGAGRSFSGQYSLYMGESLSASFGRTTPLASLEAVELDQPVALARGRECFGTGNSCSTDVDCPVGAPCVGVAPTLEITHQVRFVGWPALFVPYLQYLDRAVVQVQPADDQGTASAPWTTVTPFFNPYDGTAMSTAAGCTFDPTDDGSTEDDFFDPLDPGRIYGPSSTCFPGKAFAFMGETFEPFDAAAVGQAPHGTGLPGATGDGTWIKSRFDLSRWAGRAVRLRFLSTSYKWFSGTSWHSVLSTGKVPFNPAADDDGWWIDDVTIDRTSVVPYVVASDTDDTSGLPVSDDDGDGDGVFDVCDGCPAIADGDQQDADLDGVGDACDTCPLEFVDDEDGDGLCCPVDNCCRVANPTQQDTDGDGAGDACDTGAVVTVAVTGGDYPDLQLAIDSVTESGTTLVLISTQPGPIVIDRGLALTIVGQDNPLISGTVFVESTYGDRPIRFRGLRLAGGLVARAPTIIEDCEIDGDAQTGAYAVELLDADHTIVDVRPSFSPFAQIVVHDGASLRLDRAELDTPSGTTLRVAGTATVTNVAITGETSITVETSGTLDLRHSTVAGSSVAGLVVEPGGTASVGYSILWDNQDDVIGIGCGDVVWSNVGTPDCTGVNFNRSLDPFFVGGTGRIGSSSPLIDLVPTSVLPPGDPCADVDGKPRWLDGRGTGRVRLDLGAYEFGEGPEAVDDVVNLHAVDDTTFGWDPLPGATAYHVYRDPLSAVGRADYVTCRNDLDVDRTDTALIDGEIPAPGDVLTYLIAPSRSPNAL